MKTFKKILIIGSFVGNFLVLGAILYFFFFFRDTVRNRYAMPIFENKTSQFNLLPIDSNDVIMLGNSITEHGEWTELFDNANVKNRGIGSDITSGMLTRLDNIIKGKPAKVFIKIGTNDITLGHPEEAILTNYKAIVEKIQEGTPDTQIYIQSILPVGGRQTAKGLRNTKIRAMNNKLEVLAEEANVHYIDLFPHFLDTTQKELDAALTADGIHLNGPGYMRWVELIREDVVDGEEISQK